MLNWLVRMTVLILLMAGTLKMMDSGGGELSQLAYVECIVALIIAGWSRLPVVRAGVVLLFTCFIIYLSASILAGQSTCRCFGSGSRSTHADGWVCRF